MIRSVFLLLAALSSAAALQVSAVPGEFDRTFGSNGIASVPQDPARPEPGSARHVSVDAAGRVIVGGSIDRRAALARWTADGRADPSFGTDGLVKTGDGFLNSQTVIHARSFAGTLRSVISNTPVCFGPAAAGCIAAPTGNLAMQLNDAGSVDGSWGQGGTATLASSRNSTVLPRPDGAFYLLGSGSFVFAPVHSVNRYTASGEPDAAFNAAAALSMQCPQSEGMLHRDIRGFVQADGKLMLAQSFGPMFPSEGGGVYRICLSRLLPDGSLDASFGSAGRVVLPQSTFTAFLNRLVAFLARPGGGSALFIQGGQFGRSYVIALLTADGAMDPTHPTGIIGFSAFPVARVDAVAIQPDGKFLLAGLPQDAATQALIDTEPRIARLLPHGGVDLTFGSAGAGYQALVTPSHYLLPSALHVDSRGDILVAGNMLQKQTVTQGVPVFFAVARLSGDQPPRVAPVDGGGVGGGGGGCGSISGRVPPDPSLPALCILALLMALRNRRFRLPAAKRSVSSDADHLRLDAMAPGGVSA